MKHVNSRSHLYPIHGLQYMWLTHKFGIQVQQLVSALSPEPSEPSPVPVRRPTLTFRAAAVAVMAANRMAHLATHSNQGMACMFVLRDALPGVTNMAVCAGGQDERTEDFTGECIV